MIGGSQLSIGAFDIATTAVRQGYDSCPPSHKLSGWHVLLCDFTDVQPRALTNKHQHLHVHPLYLQ